MHPKGTLETMRENVLSAVQRREPPPDTVSLLEERRVAQRPGPKPISEELFSVKKHFEVIFEKMREGIVEISADRRVVYVNPAALKVMGLPEEEVLASPVADIFPHEYRQTVLEIITATEGGPANKQGRHPGGHERFSITGQGHCGYRWRGIVHYHFKRCHHGKGGGSRS
jgi:PAS domain-containing protein